MRTKTLGVLDLATGGSEGAGLRETMGVELSPMKHISASSRYNHHIYIHTLNPSKTSKRTRQRMYEARPGTAPEERPSHHANAHTELTSPHTNRYGIEICAITRRRRWGGLRRSGKAGKPVRQEGRSGTGAGKLTERCVAN